MMFWAAHIVEQNGRELAKSFLTAARKGDWRAFEALMNRIYGKPEEAVIARVDEHPAMPVIRSMTLEEKLQLLHSLRRGESVELPRDRRKLPQPLDDRERTRAVVEPQARRHTPANRRARAESQVPR
jgi:hypothetical protein